MQNESHLTSLGFTIGPYQLTCSITQGALKIRANANATPQPLPLALTALTTSPQAIELTLAPTHPAPALLPLRDALSERVEALQRTLRQVQTRGSVDLNPTSPRQSSISRRSIVSSQGGKLYLLNEALQEKLLRREGDMVELERRLMEREELVRELADKLITANMEKEDIFNEYEKILQNTVFLHEESRQAETKMEDMKREDQPQPSQQEGERPEGHEAELKEGDNVETKQEQPIQGEMLEQTVPETDTTSPDQPASNS